jgi:hypothetical protein
VPGGREPADVAAMSEDDGGADRSDAVHVDDRRLGCIDGGDGPGPDVDEAWSRVSSSVTYWRQVATRSAMIGSPIATPARSFTALPVLRDRPVPPSMSRHSRAWRRHTLRVRWAVSWW